MLHRSILVALGVLIVLPISSFAKGPLGQKVSKSSLIAFGEIDHSAYNALLKKYVDKDGYVKYASWQNNRTDRAKLQKYLRHLSTANLSSRATKDAKLAFWINAYNAVTIEGILMEYPTKSIRDHTGYFGYNIWEDLPLLVSNQQFSLEHIEHKILRKMGEPKIHFAIVCASVGCPRLLNEAYTAEKVQSQLATNTKDFFSRSQNLQYDAKNNRLKVSSIMDWFGEDFGSSQSARWIYLKKYLPKGAQSLATNSNTRVSFLDYNWSLNDQSRK